MPQKNKALLILALTICLLLAAIGSSHNLPSILNTKLKEGLQILQSANADALRDYLQSFGIGAAFVSAFLMILQAVISPLPAFVITLANGLLFGWFWGGLLSLVSSTAAAWLCFELSRFLGRPFIEQWMGQQILLKSDALITRFGVSAIVIARFVPVLPFDPISYAMGLSKMSRRSFLIANFGGQLPATFFYSYLGEQIPQGFSLGILGVLVGITVFGLATQKVLASLK